MDVWTIQKKEIIESVKAGGTYSPHYDYCGMSDFSLCYQVATEIWNCLNFRFDRGVVFALAKKACVSFWSAEEIGETINGFNLHMFFQSGRDRNSGW